ncbi:DNA replication licensing factor MCM7 [Binucleata daphniae]
MSFNLKIHTVTNNPLLDVQKISSFILFYPSTDNPKYIRKTKDIKIDLTDLFLYDENLYKNVIGNTLTYTSLFYKAFDRIFYDDQEITTDDENVMLYHRLARLKEKMPNVKATDVIPGELLRDYEVHFVLDDLIINKHKEGNTQLQMNNFSFFTLLRNLESVKLGKYVLVRGIITKITQTKPSLQLAAYICESCASETYQSVDKDTFIPVLQCNSPKCSIQKIRPTLILKNRASKFTTFQCATLSENTGDMPKGSVPQNIKLHSYGNICGKVKPGDTAYVSGVFVPKKLYGLIHDTHILVHEIYNNIENEENIKKCEDCNALKEKKNVDNESIDTKLSGTTEHNNVGNDITNTFTKIKNICCLLHNQNYNPQIILDSFAPEIYGLENVKKILLLSLISAPKKESNFMQVRGNINLLLVGDPGTAKSQLLKTITALAPRSVFTTGKGSSCVGLTASVTRDPLTKEMILEGGALVLSDNGVCCIDELDKMNESDRVSIHEVMEQQSISINKAGINANLNARCSIVGAANPIKGVFRNDRSLEWNLGLPVALLSRFDCVCIIKDEVEAEKDRNLAMHISDNFLCQENELNNNINKTDTENIQDSLLYKENELETNKENAQNEENIQNEEKNIASTKPSNNLITYEQIKQFIEHAKTITPVIPPNLSKILVESFVEKRKNCKTATPRYLLSLIRFTLAHARLRLSENVERIDIDEAIRLLEDNAFDNKRNVCYETLEQIVYKTIKNSVNNENKMKYDDLFVICKEHNKQKIQKILESYQNSGALTYDACTITLMQ